MSEWQDIETAPKDGAWVLLWWPGIPIWQYPCVGFYVHGGWEQPDGEEEIYPTKWFPMPPPPPHNPEKEE